MEVHENADAFSLVGQVTIPTGPQAPTTAGCLGSSSSATVCQP
jgi:hypothetical protein